MPEAFVLMNAELGSEESIVNELKKIDLVKHVYQVYGVYDIVALVEGESMDKVKETITWKLRRAEWGKVYFDYDSNGIIKFHSFFYSGLVEFW